MSELTPSDQGEKEQTPQQQRQDILEKYKMDRPWGFSPKHYIILMHVSQLFSVLLPFAGIVVPLLMWQTNRRRFAEIDTHGKQVANWVISSSLYLTISIVLVFVSLNFLLVPLIWLIMAVSAIIGAVNAGRDVVWTYPLSIKFFN